MTYRCSVEAVWRGVLAGLHQWQEHHAVHLTLQVHTGGGMKLKHSCSASMAPPGRARNS